MPQKKETKVRLSQASRVPLTNINAPIFATFGYRDPRYYITFSIKHQKVLALIDTGSTRTYMNSTAANLIGPFDNITASMTAANGKTVPVDGSRVVNYKVKNINRQISTRCIKTLNYDCIFGIDALKDFGFIVDFEKGICNLPGGGSWQVNFPDTAGAFANVMDSISSVDCVGESRYFLDVTIKGQKVRALVDSGSTKTYLGPKFEKILENSIIPVSASVLLADNSIEPILGEVNLQLSLLRSRKSLPVRLVHSLGYDCILGIDFLTSFGLKIDFGENTWQLPDSRRSISFENLPDEVSEVRGDCAGLADLSEEQQKRVKNLLSRFVKKPKKKLSITKLATHFIELTDQTPVKINPRRTSPAMLKEMQSLVDKYLEEDVIEPCKSPYSSPPVLAKKSNGTYRMCIDYRKLNSITKKHAHPIPNIDSLLDKFTNARFISKIDMTSAFLQIPVDPAVRDFTAFSVPGRGQFRFKRMPFGLSNSPSTFQEMMDKLIQNLPPGADGHVFAYLDDVCVVSETFEEHLHWLKLLLKALSDAHLEINLEKSEFCCSQVKYLGYVVDSRGLHVDPEKTKAIDDYPPPRNLRQLRRFLGMVGWYSRFMADFSLDKVSLCDLLKKDVRWHWSPVHQQAFEKIKKDLVSAPVLIRPDFTKPFQLHCDASDYAIGAVLTQEIDGQQHPIVFVNRLLTSSERKFTTTEKECKAVLWAIEKLRPYLEGFPFTVYTDHSSLLWLQKLSNPSGRLARWAISLTAYDLKLVHRPGAYNQVPDALSRAFEGVVCAAKDLSVRDAWYLNQLQLIQKFPDRYPDWKIVDTKLFIHRPDPWVDPLLGDRDAWKLVVPLDLRNKVLSETHDLPTAGHFGVDKTHKLLSRHYYWPGMKVDCSRFVKSCPDCQRCKNTQRGPAGIMHVKSYQEPWSRVVADIQGPFPPTTNQFKYLLVAFDDFTKFVVAKPLRVADGKRIWEALQEKVFLVFGYPKILHTDNGTEFDNKLIRKHCSENNIEFSTIPPYHPQSNPTERANRVLKTMIRLFLKENHRKWDEHIHEFVYAINNVPHDSLSTGSGNYSPAFMNFGRNLIRPDSAFNKATATLSSDKKDPSFWSDRLNRLSAYQDLVKRALTSASKKQSKIYNKKRLDVEFKVGDLVMRKDHPLSKAANYFSASLAKKFSGPYKIESRISQNVYKLQLPQKSKENPKTHVRFLRLFIPQDSAATMSDEEGYVPPPRRGCWNCGENHDHRTCPVVPRKVYCFTCGWLGKTMARCPRSSCHKKYLNDVARRQGHVPSTTAAPSPSSVSSAIFTRRPARSASTSNAFLPEVISANTSTATTANSRIVTADLGIPIAITATSTSPAATSCNTQDSNTSIPAKAPELSNSPTKRFKLEVDVNSEPYKKYRKALLELMESQGHPVSSESHLHITLYQKLTTKDKVPGENSARLLEPSAAESSQSDLLDLPVVGDLIDFSAPVRVGPSEVIPRPQNDLLDLTHDVLDLTHDSDFDLELDDLEEELSKN